MHYSFVIYFCEIWHGHYIPNVQNMEEGKWNFFKNFSVERRHLSAELLPKPTQVVGRCLEGRGALSHTPQACEKDSAGQKFPFFCKVCYFSTKGLSDTGNFVILSGRKSVKDSSAGPRRGGQNIVNQHITEKVILEIREQTSNMLAATALLSRRLQRNAGEREIRYLAVIEQSLYRMMRMTTHLEYSGDRDMVFRPKLMDAAELCRDLCQQVASLLEKYPIEDRKVQFTWSLAEPHVLIMTDRQLLELAMLNLISNAIEHAAPDGKVSLHAAVRDTWMTFTVRDNGEGLQEPPQPDGDPYCKQPEGMGLGLIIARKIAGLHGGSVVLQDAGPGDVSAVLSIPVPKDLGTGPMTLHTPDRFENLGGFSKVMVELSNILPSEAFMGNRLE